MEATTTQPNVFCGGRREDDDEVVPPGRESPSEERGVPKQGLTTDER